MLEARRSDPVLMSVLLVPSLIQVLVLPIASIPVGLLVACVSVVPVAWRRSRPVAAAAVGVSAWAIPTQGYLVLGYVVAIVLLYSLGAYARADAAVGWVTAWAVTLSVVQLRWHPDPVELASSLIVVLGSVVAGRLVAHQRAQADRLRSLSAELERERGLAEQAGAAEERARIARELHDVVGHEMTMIALQSEAAALALRTAPERALAPVEAIRETAHRATAELRTILGVLGQDATTSPHAVPGPSDLVELVDRARLLGVPATLTVAGEPWRNAPSTWLAVVRIVRECLTNAGRHAPGRPVTVTVQWGDRSVDLQVRNPMTGVGTSAPPSGGLGLGIAGMTERARVLGGRFEAGESDGEFVVRARLPRPWEEDT